MIFLSRRPGWAMDRDGIKCVAILIPNDYPRIV
jgi:hypothetical protein